MEGRIRFKKELKQPQRGIVHLGLGIASAVTMLFCTLLLDGSLLHQSHLLRTIVQAELMLSGVVTYVACRCLYHLLLLFEQCAHEQQHHHQSPYTEVESLTTTEEDNHNNDNNNNTNQHQDDDEELMMMVKLTHDDDDVEQQQQATTTNKTKQDEEEDAPSKVGATFALIGMPREVIIQSMYCGGTGLYLAIEPLCMWNPNTTLAFLGALWLISVWDYEQHAKPVHQLQHRVLAAHMALTLLLLGFVQHSPQHHPHPHPHNHNNNNATMLTMMTHPIAFSQWPSVLLSACSPFFLRLGGGGMHLGHLFHTMTPTQTLETALPIGLLWCTLVCSWLSSFDASLFPIAHSLLEPTRLWRALVFIPISLAAMIGFLFYTLRKRTSLISVAVLAFMLLLRQLTSSGCVDNNNNDTIEESFVARGHWMLLSSLPCSGTPLLGLTVAASLAATSGLVFATWLAYRSTKV